MSGGRTSMAALLGSTAVGSEAPAAGQTEEHQAKHAAAKAPAEVHPAAAVELPDGTAPVAEIIEACERRIFEARRVYERTKGPAREVYFKWAGPAVRLMHESKAFKDKRDPETGEAYRSFRKWCADQGVSRSHAYRMLDERPVAAALRRVYRGGFDSSQVEVLAPVLRQHGVTAAEAVWSGSAELGSTDAKTLAAVRDKCGYGTVPEDDEPPSPEKAITVPRPKKPVLRLAADRFNADEVRAFARERPDLMRLIIAAGQEAIDEVEGAAK
ncbi:hypothetical protein ACFYN0_34795 [Streptomyces sp. NPDC006704]|uniref:hypothetical protein n=1 Tax=Streptomyces sp. NPDC006704 TaxID=3364760 RepID=UPI003680D82D